MPGGRPKKYETEEERKEARRESVRKCREKQKAKLMEEVEGLLARIDELEQKVEFYESQEDKVEEPSPLCEVA
jgi:hypothetical protein